MKTKTISIIAAVASLLLLASIASASGNLPGSGWWSTQTIQNVSASSANVTVSAYASGSASVYSTSSSALGTGVALTIDPNSYSGMPGGFIGSAVVSADQPVVAIGTITNRLVNTFGVSGGKAVARYQATNNPATTLYFPIAKHNRFGSTTIFFIQNAGTSAATATATFTMDNGSVFMYTTPSIGPNQMVIISPDDAGVPDSPSDGTRVNAGSMSVTSSQPLAGTYSEYLEGQTVATALSSARAFTAADFDDKAFSPGTKRNRFGRFTGIKIVNVSAGTINATVTYTGNAGATCVGNQYVDTVNGIPAGKSAVFVQFAGTTNLPDNCAASAVITATGNFVALVNENHMTGSPEAALALQAPAENSATTKLAAPYFVDRRDEGGGITFTSGFRVMNVGSVTATNVVATFRCTGAASFTAITNPFSITAGGGALFYQPGPSGTPGSPSFTGGNPFSSNNVVCSVIVTGDQPLKGLINVAPGTAGQLDDANYEAFSITP